jgi:hypothetical protein
MALTDSSDTDTIQSSQNNTSSKVKLIINHHFPGIELVSPMYTSRYATCYLSPDQKVNVGSTMQIGFKFYTNRNLYMGALMYKLQRKNINQFNEDTISSEDETTCIQLIIIWNVNSSKEFSVALDLIEHDKGHFWNRASLMELAKRYKLFDMQYVPIEGTYLMHDNIVLMTRINVACEEGCYKFEMTISEGSVKDDTQRPQYIDVNR